MASGPASRPLGATRDCGVVAGQELRDLWLAGRGLPLAFAFSLLVSVITYLGATNQALNFLERRETVNLTVQVAVAVGALLAMLVAGDAISGERERGTLESLLLAPVSRRGLAAGKLLAALSLWLAALVVAVPYFWFLARGVGALADAVGAALVAGTLVAISLTAFGLVDQHRRPLESPQPLREPVHAAGRLRPDPAARRARSRDGRPSAPARESRNRRGALHHQGRHQPAQLDAGRRLAAVARGRGRRAHVRRGRCRAPIHDPARRRARMSRRRALLGLLACVAVTGAPAAAAAAGATPRTAPSVVVSLDRSGQAERLGASFAFGSTIANVGRTATRGACRAPQRR